jgi:hypothetical protein
MKIGIVAAAKTSTATRRQTSRSSAFSLSSGNSATKLNATNENSASGRSWYSTLMETKRAAAADVASEVVGSRSNSVGSYQQQGANQRASETQVIAAESKGSLETSTQFIGFSVTAAVLFTSAVLVWKKVPPWLKKIVSLSPIAIVVGLVVGVWDRLPIQMKNRFSSLLRTEKSQSASAQPRLAPRPAVPVEVDHTVSASTARGEPSFQVKSSLASPRLNMSALAISSQVYSSPPQAAPASTPTDSAGDGPEFIWTLIVFAPAAVLAAFDFLAKKRSTAR